MLTLSLRTLISLNSMIRLHLKTPFLYITGLEFPQTFIPTTQDRQIWAALILFRMVGGGGGGGGGASLPFFPLQLLRTWGLVPKAF